jgi:hypothetical protein
MKSMLKVLSAVALAAAIVSPVRAGTEAPADQKDMKKALEDQGINYVETAQKGITLSGYVDTSYTEQFGGGGTGFGAAQAAQHQFDVNNNNFNINAVKIALEKALPDKNDWAAGFRIDTIYGADARFLGDAGIGQATAPNTAGLALEQALVKFRIPVGNGLDIYAGKFVTFLGYEVIESPANPNFSRGLNFTDAIPLTHTGVYGDYKFNDTFEAKLGVVDGWNNSVSAPLVSPSANAFGGKAITGFLNINSPGKNANISQGFVYSPNGDTAVIGGSQELFVYDINGNWNPTFDKGGNTTLGFDIDYGTDGQAWYGAALYLQYKLGKVVTLAGRSEYLHQDSSPNPKFGAAGVSEDDYSETLTVSFAVWDNLLTRLEYRYDNLSAGNSGTGQHADQNEISAEAVYSF